MNVTSIKGLASVFCVASVMVAGGAVAASKHYSANLAQALPAAKELVVDGGIWDCAGTACSLVSNTGSAEKTVHTCRGLHGVLGVAITSFGTHANMFDADKLAACNAS